MTESIKNEMVKDREEKIVKNFQTSLRDHLLTFNDGVITIMVLSIPAPKGDADLRHFLMDAMNYSVSFFIVADF